MGAYIRIIWLGITNYSHRFGLVNLDGVAEAVVCCETQVELGTREH